MVNPKENFCLLFPTYTLLPPVGYWFGHPEPRSDFYTFKVFKKIKAKNMGQRLHDGLPNLKYLLYTGKVC